MGGAGSILLCLFKSDNEHARRKPESSVSYNSKLWGIPESNQIRWFSEMKYFVWKIQQPSFQLT